MEEGRSEAAWVARKREVLARLVPPLTHDVNNALAVVTGSSELLGRAGSALAVSEHAPRIGDEARRAARTLRALSSFAKDHPRAQETVDLAGLLEEVALLLGPFARSRGVDLDLRPAPVPARCDGRALAQAVLVLAVGACGGEGVTRGRLGVSARGSWAVLRVSVEGPDVVDAVDDVDLRGLASAADGFGGRLRRRARPGILVHELCLPRVEPEGGEEAAVDPVAVGSAPRAGASLVVVEADDLLAELVTTVLSDHGYRVRCESELSSAEEALGSCDLLILDRGASEVDLGALPCPVGLLAHRAGSAEDESGAVPTLAKPFRPADLVRFVEDCLRA